MDNMPNKLTSSGVGAKLGIRWEYKVIKNVGDVENGGKKWQQ